MPLFGHEGAEYLCARRERLNELETPEEPTAFLLIGFVSLTRPPTPLAPVA